MSLSRRAFLVSSAGALFAQRARKPNVVVIVSDDHGYAEMSCQGGDIPTPHMDSIAKNGVRFTDGYVSCPVCSPTRAGLLTGRYQQRFGHEFNPGPEQNAAAVFGLPLSEKTLPEHMKALGYETGMVGKWHLGYRPEFHPMKRGFDEFFGFLGGAHPYVGGRAILRGTEPVDEKEYLTYAFTREACAFVDRHRAEPFFLYLTYNAVHNPMQAPDGASEDRRKTFAGMLTALDEGVGKVLGKLREHKLENDTLVFFVADNGGPTPVTTSKNTPLRGFKGQTLEGGIRVPFLVQWPGRVQKGLVYRQPVIALDILPTAVAAAGGRAPGGLDGVDLLPYLSKGKTGAPHEALYWRFGEQRAIRKGRWKLVQSQSDAWELYDLHDDIGEGNNLAASQPDRVKELLADYDKWDAQLAEPKWGRPRRNRVRRRR